MSIRSTPMFHGTRTMHSISQKVPVPGIPSTVLLVETARSARQAHCIPTRRGDDAPGFGFCVAVRKNKAVEADQADQLTYLEMSKYLSNDPDTKVLVHLLRHTT